MYRCEACSHRLKKIAKSVSMANHTKKYGPGHVFVEVKVLPPVGPSLALITHPSVAPATWRLQLYDRQKNSKHLGMTWLWGIVG